MVKLFFVSGCKRDCKARRNQIEWFYYLLFDFDHKSFVFGALFAVVSEWKRFLSVSTVFSMFSAGVTYQWSQCDLSIKPYSKTILYDSIQLNWHSFKNINGCILQECNDREFVCVLKPLPFEKLQWIRTHLN